MFDILELGCHIDSLCDCLVPSVGDEGLRSEEELNQSADSSRLSLLPILWVTRKLP